MKRIPLTQGKFAIVDDEDYDFLMQWKWYFDGGYAVRNSDYIRGQKRYRIRMHRVVDKTPQKYHTDHINRDTLDNRKTNLRAATQSQNSMNQQTSYGSSIYKGVHWAADRKKWRVKIKINQKAQFFGGYDSEREAAEVYNREAKRIFGPFARLNVLDSTENYPQNSRTNDLQN